MVDHRMTKPPAISANSLTASLLIAVHEKFGDRIRLWRNNRLNAMMPGRDGKLRRVNAGIDGQGDLSGVAKVRISSCRDLTVGVRIEIEIKAGRDRQSDKQKGFQKMMEDHGAIYIICRDAAECLDEINRRLTRLEVAGVQQSEYYEL
jgi:hypothetical protein